MGYDLENERAHKTGRIAILSILIFLLGVLFFAYKTESCKEAPSKCKDEFHEIRNDYRDKYTCYSGAVAEVVNSPPAAKPGILCRCPNSPETPTPPPTP